MGLPHEEETLMKELVNRLTSAGLTVYTDDELQDHLKHDLVSMMQSGRFSDALPDPFIHELATFMKQAAADGHRQVAISLVLKDRGLASFIYDIDVSPTGITYSNAVEWYVPKKANERRLPTSFHNVPRLAIDVSNP
jgi:hypothetical protein